MEELAKVLIANGPMGIVAGVMFYLLWAERNDHKETRIALINLVGKYEELVSASVEATTKVATLVGERLPNRNHNNNGN